ncbi:glutamyl aminopeptidase-like [Paramuricea clavata]|uniref:Aminopeptidase n=1 Tax=Paramuricea clavata TaxID=317549 RepID=A0A7D9IH62_PARCT|nr:glutamyl aminopeptidase-like [Paramuricea clavata]
MSVDNPTCEHSEGAKKFGTMESQEPISFTNSSKSKKREPILIIILLVLFVISLAFIILYAQEKDDNDSSEGSSGHQGGGTVTPTTLPNETKPTSTPTYVTTTTLPNATTPAPTSEPDYGPGPWTNVRLPTYFKPHHYDLELVVNLEPKLIFSGDVSVNVTLSQETPYMYLHTNKLNISNPTLKKDDTVIKLKRHFWYKKNEFYVMEAEQNLTSGVYVISMEFIGKLDDDLKGLYRSTYKNQNGTKVTIATTQLQPTDARKAFPCFDEPSFKATFTVTMVRPKDMISISNMPQIGSEKRSDSMVADHYEKTVIMPTYLLAFIVCDFGYLQDYAGEQNASMKYYATKGQLDQAEYARSVGGPILSHFEEYFNISYPLPKADMIAVPDFAAGAMENWGLIIYRETAMLFKDGQSSEGNRERIVQVIAHELAHMWFGNLVTTAWWDDLWLNEGFASFVEYIGVNHIHPDWNMNDMFVNLDMKNAFRLDALVTSHPILLPVNHPDEINEIFDSISYNKGATIIRMLQYFLTEKIFKNGLINYLNAHAYGNAKTKDLWNYLTMVRASKAGGKDINVAEVMDTWTLQMGFPVVNVTENSGNIILTQQRFLSDPDANISNTKFTSDYGYKWHIPFTIAVGQKQDNSEVKTVGFEGLIWMNRTSDETTVPNKTWDPNTQWVKGNIGQTGYYRVNYPTKNWELLAQQLQYNHSVFSLGDRAGLILDAFALADAGLLEFKYALNMTKYLEKETNFIPWDSGYSSLSSLTSILPKSEKIYTGLRNYRFKLMKPNFDRLGFFDNGTHLEKYLRVDAVYTACGVRNKVCMDKTKELFDKWIRNESHPVPPDLRSAVYLYGMTQSGVKEWDITFERLQKTNVASERRKLMYGLAGTPEPWILNRYLQYAFDEKKIKSQDTSAVLSYVANVNPIGRHFAWNFLKEMWPTILEKYGKGFGFSINRFVNGVASSFSTEWELKEVISTSAPQSENHFHCHQRH